MKTYSTSDIRNVAVIGHGSAGKTTLVEAMLARAGAISRIGRVEDGTATTDFEPEEQKRKVSVSLGLAPLEWRDTKVNLLDTPGYADFVGEVHAALHVADAALLVLCAASGVEVGSEQTWRAAEALGLPRMIVINKIDRENADFARTLEQARASLGKRCVPVQMPIGSESNLQGIIDLVHMKARLGAGQNDEPIPQEFLAQAQALREAMIESVAETDDDLIARYLDGETLSDDEIIHGLHNGTREGKIYPVFCSSALGNKGIGLLLDDIVTMAPAPGERQPIHAEAAGADEIIEPDPTQPVVAQVFKSTADPFIGKLTYLRVFRGTLKSDSHVWNVATGRDERIGQLFCVRGKQQEPVAAISAGDIGAVAKLADTHTGDTLADREHQVELPRPQFPAPSFATAVAPKTKADLDKLGNALTRLVEEDPTITVTKEAATGETILSGLGEAHVEVAAEKMKRKFGVDVLLSVPRIPYRETISVPVKAEYKHKKQTGGHGQYGHVLLELHPQPRGAGFEFGEKVVGGSVPKNYIPAVEKGVQESLTEGVLAGYPVVDVKVVLYDGSYHPVDSSEMAFKLAASQAFKKGMSEARPVLLEPVWRLQIRVPEQYLGDVMGDLNTRRAHVVGTIPEDGYTVVEAQAPLSEVMRYATVLRSITQGRGTYTMAFDHYAEVPAQAANQIIASSRKAEAS